MINWVKNNIEGSLAIVILSASLIGNYQVTNYKIIEIEKALELNKELASKIDSVGVEVRFLKKNQETIEGVFEDLKILIKENTVALNESTTNSKVIIEKIENLDKRVEKLEG